MRTSTWYTFSSSLRSCHIWLSCTNCTYLRLLGRLPGKVLDWLDEGETLSGEQGLAEGHELYGECDFGGGICFSDSAESQIVLA